MIPTSSAAYVLSCGPNAPPKMREVCNFALQQAASANGGGAKEYGN